MSKYGYMRVGHFVRHMSNNKGTGRILALSHSRDEYLILWLSSGTTSRHSRMALLPVVK
jgi:hypothetical protein